MSTDENESDDIVGPLRRRVYRKRRSFWRRRQFWIALFAVIFAILMVLWLISNLGSHHAEME